MAEKNKKRVKQKAQGKPVPETVNETQEEKNNQDATEETALPKPFEFVLPENAKEPEDAEAEKALKKADSFLSSRKTAFALIVTLVTLLMTAGFYLYRKGQLDYYHVDDIWNTFADKGMLYKLLIPICGVILAAFSWLIPALPIIFFPALAQSNINNISKSTIPSKKKEEEIMNIIFLKRIMTLFLSFLFAVFLIINIKPILKWLFSQPLKSSPWVELVIFTLFVGFLASGKACLKAMQERAKKTDLMTTVEIKIFMVAEIITGAGLCYAICDLGECKAAEKRDYSFICFTEEKTSPHAEQLQALNILCPVITTATTSTTASGTTTTDTVTTGTTTTTTTAPIDMPDDVPVYVILAENKDNYLAAAGMVRQGGRLDLDRDCQIMLEKKNQIVLKKTFTEVNVDYIFDYQIEKEEPQS